MRLRNKKTGEIRLAEAREDGLYLYDETTEQWYKYELDLLAKWWGYYKENNYYWYIDDIGMPSICSKHHDKTAKRKAFGNYFESGEEAKRAVEKLKAFKRLSDKGFRFDGWEDLQAEMGMDDLMFFNRDVINTDNVIGFRMDDYHDCIKDLNICFGGEE